jgi:hypothetical protein
MSESNKTAGGRATESGMSFQAAVATWFAAQLLANMPIGSQFGLPRGIRIVALQCESGDAVDDVVVSLEGGGFIRAQCKTRPGLTSGEDSPLAKAIEQLVRLYVRVGQSALAAAPNAVLMAVARDAPQSLETLEDACRMFDYGGMWDTVLAQLPSKRQEALTLFSNHVRTSWSNQTTDPLTSDALVSMARLFRIHRFDEDVTGTEWRETARLLGRRLFGADEAGEAPMNELLTVIRKCIRNGAPMDRDGLLRSLRNAGYIDVSAPTYYKVAYEQRNPTHRMPDLHLDLVCEAEDGILLRGFGGSHEEVLGGFHKQLEEARELEADSALEAEERAKLESWISQGEAFLQNVSHPDDFLAWALRNREGTPFRLRVTNQGEAPATGIMMRLVLPEWLLPSLSSRADLAYEGVERPSGLMLLDLMQAVEIRKGTYQPPTLPLLGAGFSSIIGMQSSALFGQLKRIRGTTTQMPELNILMKRLDYPRPAVARSPNLRVDGRVVEGYCKRLVHTLEWSSDKFWLFELADAQDGVHELTVNVFAEEQLDWTEHFVTIQLG